MICWYCYWGWAKPVAEIYLKALKKLNNDSSPLHYGPAHVVWEDENWYSAEWCLNNFETYKGRFSEEELAIVKWSLEELIKIPLKQREIEPDDYDGLHPENYPPVDGIEVIKI